MKTGTKSLLFGVHQFLLHPFFVLIAWIKLYGLPNFREMFCIIVHDWGYWGKPNMDGEEGERHPELGAAISGWLFGRRYRSLCLFHSRHYARQHTAEPSRLCWADKLSIAYEPWWLYLPRAWASGELHEYRQLASGGKMADAICYVPLSASHRQWYRWVQSRLVKLAEERCGDAVPYINPVRNK